MRKRSLSVAFERSAESDEMRRKFEGVNDVHSESDEDESDEMLNVATTGWSRDDYDKLLSKLRANVPVDIKSYKYTLMAIDWEQVAFGKHSPKEVEEVTKALVQKIRKFRTLSEMVEDIPAIGAKIVKAALPKKPPSAYNLFMKEKYAFYKEKYKGTGINLMKKLAEEFAALSNKKKRKYEQMAEQAKEAYKAELEKFYRENPHLEVKPTQKISQPRVKLLNTKILTPFKMFVNEKRKNGLKSSLPEMRAMWDDLEKKQRYKYIQECFQHQSGDNTLKLTKEEQNIVEYASGKPEPISHNLCDFYLKKQPDIPKSATTASAWRKEKMAEYKSLPKMRKLELELEYRRAKMEFVHKYQEYISNLPEESMRRSEHEQLQLFVTSKLDKDERREYNQNTMNTILDGTSATLYSDMPIAESTTNELNVQQNPSKTNKKKKTKDVVATPEKQVTVDAAAAATKNDKVNGKQLKSILKSPPPTPFAEPSANRKHKLLSGSPAVSSPKKQKRQEEVESDRSSDKVDRKPTIENGNAELILPEPTCPPRSALKYYKLHYYHGKPEKCKESFEKLSEQRKEAIRAEALAAQKRYSREVHAYLIKLPQEKSEAFLKRMQKAARQDTDEESLQSAPIKANVQTKQELQSSSSESDSEDERPNAGTSSNITYNDVSSSNDDDDSDSEEE
uniref:HMG box domain-containing protein n=1 Tax=Anopheles farauti TaxID=69004 RepID=A0A182Q6K6_9DIPT